MEHWDELKPGGLRIVYDDTLFAPGTDSFLLSSLPRLKPGLRVCDLGCGTGLLGLLLLQRQAQLQVTGIELQAKAAQLAEKAIAKNALANRFSVLQEDLRNVKTHFPTGSFDLVICNPPYYPPQSGALSNDPALQKARAETGCNLEDICRAAAYLLRWGGSFCLVHKPERLTDLLCSLRQFTIEPKRLRFVCKTGASAPSLLLLEARRGGKPGLTVDAPLILQNPDGTPTPEVDAIYFRSCNPQEDQP